MTRWILSVGVSSCVWFWLFSNCWCYLVCFVNCLRNREKMIDWSYKPPVLAYKSTERGCSSASWLAGLCAIVRCRRRSSWCYRTSWRRRQQRDNTSTSVSLRPSPTCWWWSTARPTSSSTRHCQPSFDARFISWSARRAATTRPHENWPLPWCHLVDKSWSLHGHLLAVNTVS